MYNADTIKQAIIDNFNGVTEGFVRIKMGDTLYSSRFYQSVINAGLNELVKIELSTDNSIFGLSVDFNLNQMPVLEADNITFTEVKT